MARRAGRRIETPRGKLVQIKFKGGRVSCRLTWNRDFGPRRTSQFQSVQEYVDAAVLRYCRPYVPMQSGFLMRSGDLGTVIGSGEVSYIAPYAHRLYYGVSFTFDTSAHPSAGALWFERAMIDHKADILRGAAKLAGGKAHGV